MRELVAAIALLAFVVSARADAWTPPAEISKADTPDKVADPIKTDEERGREVASAAVAARQKPDPKPIDPEKMRAFEEHEKKLNELRMKRAQAAEEAARPIDPNTPVTISAVKLKALIDAEHCRAVADGIVQEIDAQLRAKAPVKP